MMYSVSAVGGPLIITYGASSTIIQVSQVSKEIAYLVQLLHVGQLLRDHITQHAKPNLCYD